MNKEISKEEAIEILKKAKMFSLSETNQALTLAIEALEHKPSGEGGKSAEEVLKEHPSTIEEFGVYYLRESVIEAMHEFHNQFQPPVISDEEIQNENYRRFDLIGMNGTFNDGAVWMRKLLTNKEY